MTSHILVIDDEADIRDVLADILEDEGYSVLKAAHSEQALSIIEKETISLIILDIWLENSDMDGIEILKTLKSKNSSYKDIPVLMISGHGNVEMAVNAMKVGAYDFIEKPFKIDHMLLTVERALEQGKLKRENIKLRDDAAHDVADSGYATKCTSFQALIRNAEDHAKTDARIMIGGQIGTGKSKFARYLYGRSVRRNEPLHEFVASELSEQLIDQIFTHENYHSTTILIKRVETLSSACQSLLLKHVSSMQSPQTSPRLICTAFHNIQESIAQGDFSSALYDRISVAHIEMPALHERYEDIPDLINQFSINMCSDMNSAPVSFGADAIVYLQDYRWKGNIRQLKSTIDWITLNHILNGNAGTLILTKDVQVILEQSTRDQASSNVIETPNLIQPTLSDDYLDKPLREARENFEKYYLTALMKRFRGNISQMAGHIDMERTALHRKLKTLDIRYDDIVRNENTERAAG